VPGPRAVALALVFATLVAAGFGRWGHVRTDTGGSLDRAARVAEGQLLYRDVQSPYGPLPDWVVAGAFRVFGVHLAVAWAIGLALVVAESLLLWRLARRFASPAECAVGVAAFWAAFALAPGLFNWVLPSTFASTFGATLATAALLLAVRARERGTPGAFAAAGVAAGAAALCKPDYGLAAALAAAAAASLAPRGRRLRLLAAALVPGVLLGAGTLALLAALVSWDVLLGDNLSRVRSVGQTLARLRAGVPAWGPLLASAVLRYGVELPLRAAAAAWGLELAAARGARRAAGALVVLAAVGAPLVPGYPTPLDHTLLGASLGYAWSPAAWLVVALAALPAARRGERGAAALVLAGSWSVALALRWDLRLVWPSYYGVLAPFLLLVVAARAAALVSPRRAALAASAVVAVPVALQALGDVRQFAHYGYALAYPRGTLRTQHVEGAPLAAVIDYVRAHTAPDDWVAVFPEERLVNFLAERRHPTRDPGVGPGWLATPADEEACIAELEARRPRLVVLSNRRWPEFGAGALGTYAPRLRAWIDRHYAPVLTTPPNVVVRYTVLAPRDDAATAPAAAPGPPARRP
jgi:hypothetical protein